MKANDLAAFTGGMNPAPCPSVKASNSGGFSLRGLLLHDLKEKDDEVRMMRAYIQACPEM